MQFCLWCMSGSLVGMLFCCIWSGVVFWLWSGGWLCGIGSHKTLVRFLLSFCLEGLSCNAYWCVENALQFRWHVVLLHLAGLVSCFGCGRLAGCVALGPAMHWCVFFRLFAGKLGCIWQFGWQVVLLHLAWCRLFVAVW